MGNRADYLKAAESMRKDWAKSDAIRDEGIVVPSLVRQINDIAYTSSNTEEEKIYHLTDIYYPDTKMDKYPVIVSIHGGGWFYGDKELYRLYTTYLASKGFAVINFNYRLSPSYVYPSGFSDVCHLMDFINKNANEYKLDLNKIYVVGDSAGAQFTAQYSLYACSKEYRDLFDFSKDISYIKPNKIALNCGIYDMAELYNDDPSLTDWYLPDERDEFIEKSFFNMFDYMNDEFPSTYIMLSVNDGLSKYTNSMKVNLENHNIPMIYREFGQDNKDDGHVFHLNLRSEAGKLCNKEEIEFFNK